MINSTTYASAQIRKVDEKLKDSEQLKNIEISVQRFYFVFDSINNRKDSTYRRNDYF